MKILIDAGHGANEYTNGKYSPKLNGTIKDETIYKDRFREGNFNRIVAKEIVKQLKAKGYDSELVVTEDQDISLVERVRRVNNVCNKIGTKNVLLISIHSNALGHGEDWYTADYWTAWTTKGQTKSDKLATQLWEDCKKVMPSMKFGKQMVDGDVDYESNFYIIYKTLCPAVLTENFFYTHKDNLKFIASPEGRKKIVEGHVNGIINYIKSL